MQKQLIRKRLTNKVTVSPRKLERTPEFSVIFIPRKLGRKSKSAPIYCRLTYAGQRTMFATGVHCTLADFDAKAVTINGQPDQTRVLQALKAQAERGFSDLRVTGRKISTSAIRDLALGKTLTFEQVPILVVAFKHFLDERSKPEVQTGDIDLDTHKQHERWAIRIAEYFVKQYGSNCELNQVKPADAKGLLIDLKQQSKHCHNYAEKIVQHTKRILNYAVEKEWISRNPFMNYRARREFKKGEFLTAEELSLIEESRLASPVLNRIRSIFLFQCYTGLAYKDVAQLRQSHILTDKETGWQYIKKEREKSGVTQIVPLTPQALAILEHYREDKDCKRTGLLLPIPSNQKTNGYLQQIAACLNISKIVRTHVARRTFSNLLKAKGMDVKNISVMLGHTNTAMTERHYLDISPAMVIKNMQRVIRVAKLKQA
ncbi:site-specific integrase [Spirosoma aureum]|uniref:Site-specific integrase n=1 Tax=Spirosoma aureum TaxID=2692134 RepID=A0A6G9AKK0_9BACT|nr:site-specific integrase [Spirosoma aureum]QIP12987.1 site-specific integrase [Spirosoma aureum]